MSFHVISCHFMSFHVISCRFMSFHVISCHFMSFHVILCHIMSFQVSLDFSLLPFNKVGRAGQGREGQICLPRPSALRQNLWHTQTVCCNDMHFLCAAKYLAYYTRRSKPCVFYVQFGCTWKLHTENAH
jgi:hypothetical protein